jgi:hypothetical protein
MQIKQGQPPLRLALLLAVPQPNLTNIGGLIPIMRAIIHT